MRKLILGLTLLTFCFFGCSNKKETQDVATTTKVDAKTATTAVKGKNLGIATMKKNGAIQLVLRTKMPSGQPVELVIEYGTDDVDYNRLLEHVGGLTVGETKFVKPWPGQEGS